MKVLFIQIFYSSYESLSLSEFRLHFDFIHIFNSNDKSDQKRQTLKIYSHILFIFIFRSLNIVYLTLLNWYFIKALFLRFSMSM